MRIFITSLLIISVVMIPYVEAQDTLQTGYEVIAEVSEAKALAVDQDGLLYIVTSSAMHQFDHHGQLLTSLDGSSKGVFGELSDMDPGNGLIWVLADFALGSLLRFSKQLLHLETIRIPNHTTTEFGHSPRLDLRDEFTTSFGQPISVSTGVSGEIFVIDRSSQNVLKWDSSRRLERVIGEFGTGSAQLVEPTKIATSSNSIYVADRGVHRINIYDYFGGYQRSIPSDQEVESLTVTGQYLWVIYSSSILIYTDQGRLSRQVVMDLDDPLVAAEPRQGYIFLLTSTQLLKVKFNG